MAEEVDTYVVETRGSMSQFIQSLVNWEFVDVASELMII